MRLLLLSNAKCEGMGYLEHAREHVRDFLGGTVPRVLFVPFAAVTRSYDDFVGQTLPVFDALGVAVEGIHRCTDPVAAVNEAPALMIGGGNTWKLLRELRSQALLPAIRARVERGMPYIGWSAGSNVACPTIMTTNDMPICDPHGFDALGLVPFQINPHYLHGNPPGFKGETREERINEYLALHPDVVVAGLREGTAFRVEDATLRLLGDAECRVFRHGQPPRELTRGDDFGFLLAPR
ncbi:MAG: dipeptidase PepE [Betaproteobacteria bacterium]|jgi:dipeptidase E|nr:dipeptidase PepE [Betaproteobacteria bacterium]MBK7080139.1 dipeptidase PepE [Betaproteobacteria bacterium]MBK7591045.1 dipeptidase PepE [Betaproteobacteria bacterium]MBK7743195.1 dipeptidase PepE [Betaproteobacteria bacterium]MBK8687876.1 dipeptidase PepE [Betaproteobacteria bacterium]